MQLDTFACKATQLTRPLWPLRNLPSCSLDSSQPVLPHRVVSAPVQGSVWTSRGPDSSFFQSDQGHLQQPCPPVYQPLPPICYRPQTWWEFTWYQHPGHYSSRRRNPSWCNLNKRKQVNHPYSVMLELSTSVLQKLMEELHCFNSSYWGIKVKSSPRIHRKQAWVSSVTANAVTQNLIYSM